MGLRISTGAQSSGAGSPEAGPDWTRMFHQSVGQALWPRETRLWGLHGVLKALSSCTLVFSYSSWRTSAPSPTTVYPFSPRIPEQTVSVLSPWGNIASQLGTSVKCLSCLGLVNDPSPPQVPRLPGPVGTGHALQWPPGGAWAGALGSWTTIEVFLAVGNLGVGLRSLPVRISF